MGRRDAIAGACGEAWLRGAYGGEMSTGWLGNIDSDRVSEVLLVDGWHSIDVPSFTVNPSEESFSFDETLAHTHTSTRTRVVFGPLSAILAVSYGEVT